MRKFLTGDELGQLKSVRCSADLQSSAVWKLEERILFTPSVHAKINSGELEAERAKECAVQKLTIGSGTTEIPLLTARSNGTISAFSLGSEEGHDKIDILQEWKEPRFKESQPFVGLDVSLKGLFWCTSNGALGLAAATSDGRPLAFSPTFQKSSLPTRLCAWRLAPDASTFAYGGNEIDLSVWDTERAFQSKSLGQPEQEDRKLNSSKKRKRGGDLLPAEIWRAKNLPNDFVGLRQPIHITSLTHLSSSSVAGPGVHIVTGTESGDVRRYDTRAACRPVTNWTGIAKVGGVGVVQAGLSEHELFVSDAGTNLFALDLRSGRTIYSYKKIQGAVTSIAPSSGGLLGSTSRDRFFRLHSTSPPPGVAGSRQDERGEVLGAVYMKAVPTAVVSFVESGPLLQTEKSGPDTSEEDEDDVWSGMKDVNDSDGENEGHRQAKR